MNRPTDPQPEPQKQPPELPPRLRRDDNQPSAEDVREIRANLTGFFAVLREWSEKEKARPPPIPPDYPPKNASFLFLTKANHMYQVKKSPLKYHGGKSNQAKSIISLMPEHVHYVEAFFGGGSVLFAKNPEGISEVVNDICGHLTDFWRVVQDESLFSELVKKCERTPFSEWSWDQTTTALNHDDQVVRAHALLVRNRLSRQGLQKDFATLSRNRERRGMNEQVSSWLTAIEGLPQVHERLKRVVILNRPAIDVIQQQDGGRTLHYLDPPYVQSTRVATSAYQHEMSDRDHHELVDVILKCSGKVMLSGYVNDIYRRLEAAGWETIDFEVTKSSSSQKSKPKAIERIWANFEPNRDAIDA